MQTGYQQVSHNYFKNLVRQLCRRLRLLNRGPNQEIVRRIVVGQYGARRPGLRAMGCQQGNGLERKALLLNQFAHIRRNGREREPFERRTGKKNQILRSRRRRAPGSLDRKGFDMGK